MTLAGLVQDLLGDELAVGITAYDGSRAGPIGPPAVIHVLNPEGLRRMMSTANELGFIRSYLAGDVEIDGDMIALLEMRDVRSAFVPKRETVLALAQELGPRRGRRSAGAAEVVLHGPAHSQAHDSAAVTHHYDASNAFFELVLDPSLAYTCAVFDHETDSLEQAQANKHELVCRKLGLERGMRLLDLGCGWGGMAIHAARHHGVDVVGVTIAQEQADLGTERVEAAGLSAQVEIRLQDYREVADGPYDAISSIGMIEHVGTAQLGMYFDVIRQLLRPGGRCLVHGITRPFTQNSKLSRQRAVDHYFTHRYLFPAGETYEPGQVVSHMHDHGLEVRHLEALREHYVLTLRHWVANLERRWDQAVAEVGPVFAKSWRMFMAGGAVSFAKGSANLHQLLAVRLPAGGSSGFPLRPSFA